MSQRDADVLILGAGAAGLAAAHDLSRGGVGTLVLEARDRIGGRIHTLHEHAGPTPIELGAEFVHGRAESIWRIIRDARLGAYDVAENHWHVWRGRPRPMSDFWERLEKVMKPLQRLRRDTSFAEYLQRIKDRGLAQEKNLAAMFVEGFDAAYPDQISAKSLAAEQGQIGEDATQFRLLDGYDSLLRPLMTKEVQASVRLGTTVARLRWRRGVVEACDERSGVFTARVAIVTLPLALLQVRDGSRGSVRFEPEIDQKRRAASMLAVGPVIKLVLRFGEPFWEREKLPSLPRGQSMRDMSFIHWRDAPFPTWWTTLPLRTPILTAWAGGPKADALVGRGHEAMLDEAIKTLGQITGVSRRRISAMLESSHTHDWQSDPLSRGAYSYVRVGGENARAALARPIQRTLYFAGEATDTTGEAGTVVGALASGHRAAREVLKALA